MFPGKRIYPHCTVNLYVPNVCSLLNNDYSSVNLFPKNAKGTIRPGELANSIGTQEETLVNIRVNHLEPDGHRRSIRAKLQKTSL